MLPPLKDSDTPIAPRSAHDRIAALQSAPSGGWVPDAADPPAAPHQRWGRLAERWVPESLREARIAPSKPAALLVSLVAALAAVIAALGVWWSKPQPAAVPTPAVPGPMLLTETASAESGESPTTLTAGTHSTSSAPTGPLVISVTGRVHSPGLVTVTAPARVADAIAAAGGALDTQELTGLNLAALLADGDSVVVGGPAGSSVDARAAPASEGSGGRQLVNINTADRAELETLPGVGPVTAQAIVDWRTEHGSFTDIEQLQAVSGIGPATLARLAELVTV